MAIWIKSKVNVPLSKGQENNILLKFEDSIDLEVKRAFLAFLEWIEKEYVFPKKVIVSFFSSVLIEADDGEMVSATCFLPYDKNEIPYIKIATGDYLELVKQNGRDDALAAILHSLTHEFTHYFQWIKDIDSYDKKMEKQAIRCADYVMYKYACTREHP